MHLGKSVQNQGLQSIISPWILKVQSSTKTAKTTICKNNTSMLYTTGCIIYIMQSTNQVKYLHSIMATKQENKNITVLCKKVSFLNLKQ